MEPEEIIHKHCSKMNSKKFKKLIGHSEDVFKECILILKKHPELNADKKTVKDMALLHDIGTCELKPETPYINHGILGRKILEEEGLYKIAKICERHIGSGITKSEAKLLKLPEKDMLPKTIEEKIVCYADKFYSKSKPGKHKIKDIFNEFETYSKNSLKRFKKLHQLFS